MNNANVLSRFLGLSILTFSLSIAVSHAQFKIGNDVSTIDTFSILELESNSKALVLTRVSD